MGLSINERNRRKRVLDYINSLSTEEVEELKSYNTITESLNSGKYVNMQAIQDILDNNTFEKIVFGEGDSFDDNKAVISLFFMSNKNVKLAEGSKNVFRIIIKRDLYSRDDEKYFYVESGFDDKIYSITDFNESPIKYNTKEATMTFDLLVDKCDYNAIYDSMLPLVENNLKRFDLMAYSLFKSDSIKHLRNFNISTLAVGLHKKTGRYIYHYNPRFILREALEEYVNRGSLYNSLQDCYVYLLTFFIAHEMAHLITNNQVHFSGGNSDVDLDGTYASGGMDNVVMDGFINAKLKVALARTPNLTRHGSSGGVFPANCIKDTIHMRVQHNVGLKKFKSADDMVNTVVATLNKVSGLDKEATVNVKRCKDSLSNYWGADVFCNFFVGSAFRELRASSHIFQRVITDVVRVLTSGKIYWSKSGGITDEEKVSDKEILANGTLVKVKGTNIVGIIKGYKPVKKDDYITLDVYTVNKAKIDSVDVTDLGNGAKLNSPVYVDSCDFYADLDRKYIIPIDGSYGSWVEGTTEEKTSLSAEDLADDSSDSSDSSNDMGDMGGGTQPKSVKVGDIVWISKNKKFGIVTSIVNGSFHVEDVREEPCIVLDDSDNHL